MIPKFQSRISKGMIFGGCSFTWGQGLYYYSNLPTIKEPMPDQFDVKLVTEAHLRYMESVRYPRLVANHFNAWELVAPGNGGSNLSITRWWDGLFTNLNASNNLMPQKKFEFSEVSHFIFQFTQYQRDNFIFEYGGKKYDVPFAEVSQDPLQTIFIKWLEQQDVTLEQWLDNYFQDNLNRVTQLFKKFEEHGVETYIILWPTSYLPYVEKNNYLNKKLIKLHFNNTVYASIEDIMKQHKNLEIKYDYENFEEPPKDHHPSKKCHEIIANSIIAHLENIHRV